MPFPMQPKRYPLERVPRLPSGLTFLIHFLYGPPRFRHLSYGVLAPNDDDLTPGVASARKHAERDAVRQCQACQGNRIGNCRDVHIEGGDKAEGRY